MTLRRIREYPLWWYKTPIRILQIPKERWEDLGDGLSMVQLTAEETTEDFVVVPS